MARYYNRPRDDQKSSVYKAEREAFQGGRLQQQDVSTPERIRRRLDQILLDPRFMQAYPKTVARKVGVEFGRLGGANANGERIRFGRNSFAMQEWVLVHELAHVVVRRENPTKYAVGFDEYTDWNVAFRVAVRENRRVEIRQAQGHGRKFCDVYLQLAEWFLAPGAADQLRAAFDANRVRYTRAPSIVAPQPQTTVDEPTTTLAAICQSLGLDPKMARRRLRAAGLRAPYTNAQAILTILKR